MKQFQDEKKENFDERLINYQKESSALIDTHSFFRKI